MIDYLIKDGLVIDGSGAEPVETNIGIQEDRITYIGSGEIEEIGRASCRERV